MNYEVYKGIEVTDDFNVIDFISIGKNGSIPKRIAFTPTDISNVYNLAFGDVDENGEINDYIISNNGDRNKILATIADTVDSYTKRYSDRWIIFSGSTKERNRLYRMAIGLHLDLLSSKFHIYAYVNETIIPFAKTMETNAFLIKRKSS